MKRNNVLTLTFFTAIFSFLIGGNNSVFATEPTQAEINEMYSNADAEAAFAQNNWDEFISDKFDSQVTTAAVPDFRPGDILVTMDYGYASFRWGHAAIVYWANEYTMESYDNTGVVLMKIDKWKPSNTKMKTMIALKVSKATYQAKEIARTFAGNAKGKPYNFSFYKPERLDAYYCSSLIWRAYERAGHGINGGYDKLVSPYDIVEDSDTVGYYVKR